jgi:hypothetical protein
MLRQRWCAPHLSTSSAPQIPRGSGWRCGAAVVPPPSLEEHATFADADEGGATVAPPPSKILRVDAVHSCEYLLAKLTGQVFSAYATMCIFVMGVSDF